MLSRHSIALAAALTLAGVTAIPAGALATSAYQMQTINAEFVPTREQVENELSNLNQRLEGARKASFYSGEAYSEDLEARRYYEFGRYDEALAHARNAEGDLPAIPNWVNPTTASQ